FPFDGLTIMLKSTVPTCAYELTTAGVGAIALILKTSRSGSEKRMSPDQSRPSSSTHFAPSNFTMRPTSRCATCSKFSLGAGRPPGDAPLLHDGALAPPLQTSPSLIVVVWLPDSKIAA